MRHMEHIACAVGSRPWLTLRRDGDPTPLHPAISRRGLARYRDARAPV